MREIKSGDMILRIRASALTIFLFKQEFKCDIMKTLGEMFKDMAKGGEPDLDNVADTMDSVPDGYAFLQILWALNKTQNVAEKLQTQPFNQWIEAHADISIMDVMQDVLEEAMQGFFRIKPKEQSPTN